MPRRRTLRILYALYEKGSYGTCGCGGPIYYYSDHGVRCSNCKRLYGVWNEKKDATQIGASEDSNSKTEPASSLATNT